MPNLKQTERPIIFSGPMVRAILDGRKTQTRRVIRPAPRLSEGLRDDNFEGDYWFWKNCCWQPHETPHRELALRCRYGQAGDRLWVRETFQLAEAFECFQTNGSARPPSAGLVYQADLDGPFSWTARPWRPAIYMPRNASRLNLEILSVRAERLHEITEADSIAEGVSACRISADEDGPERIGFMLGPDDGKTILDVDPRESFRRGWELINAKRAPWSENPWVWVITFRRMHPYSQVSTMPPISLN